MAADDGSIVIDTELDNSGFEKGSDKLLSAVKDLTNAVDNLGDNMMQSFQGFLPLLQSIGNSTSQIYAKLTDSGQQVADANAQAASSVKNVASAAKNADSATQAVLNGVRDGAQNAARAMGTAEQATQGLSAELNANLPKDLSTAERTCSSLSERLNQLSDRASLGFQNDSQLAKFGLQVDVVKRRIAELQEQMNTLGSQKVLTPDYQWMQDTLAKTEKSLDTLLEKQNKMSALGVKESSAAYKSLAYDIQQAEAQIGDLKGAMESMRNDGEAFISVGDTSQFKQTSAALDEMAAKANELPTKADGMNKFRDILQKIGAAATKIPAQLAKITFTGLKKGLSGIGKAAKSVASSVKKAISSLNLFNKHSKSAGISANGLVRQLTSLKTLLISRIKSAFVSMLVKNSREGINELAKFSGKFDNALSNMRNGMKELGANIAVTFSSIIQQFEPIITQFINALSEAVLKVNALFAVLSGRKTMTVAKNQTDSYAESLDDASESAKELKSQVYGFDELNKRSSQSDDSQKKKSETFEEVPINEIVPEDVLSTIDKIKDAIENNDWNGLGKIIADGLNNILKNIDDWINNVFRPKGVEWARNIAELLNGLVDGLDWVLLGKTIADGLNAIADIINTFLTTFNFENLGNGIGESINSFFGNMEWDLIGQTFANGWNALIDFIFGLVSTVDWSLIGDSFAEFFNNFFFTVDWVKGSQAIAIGLNGIVEAFQHFLDGVDWNAVGETIGRAADSLITGIDWKGIGKLIGTALNDLVKIITSTILSIDWSNLGTSVANGFNSLFSTVDWEGIAEGINVAISGLFDTVNSFLKQMDWSQLGAYLGNFINALDVESWLADFGTFVSDLIVSARDLLIGYIEEIDWGGLTDALWNGICGMIQNVDWTGIINKTFESFGAAIGAAGSIVATLAVDIWDLLKDAWESVKTYFFGIHRPIRRRYCCRTMGRYQKRFRKYQYMD